MIRKATVADAEGIARVHVDCWRTTYKDIISEKFLTNLSYEQRTKLWVNNISRKNDSVFVAVNDDEKIIGFTSGGNVKLGEYQGYDGDVTSIYILKKFQGLGIGKKLLKRLFTEFESLNFHSVIVKVLEENKSCHFYEAMGAEIIDSTSIKMADDNLKLLVYGWEDIST
ncbi:GNAT family N-acetyltransferase [Virgibacillus necropolis]|nr:GNAT family N-acetyltransferase [Virgibacillus necropolis]